MKKIKKTVNTFLITMFLMPLLLSSCEKVIDIKLGDTKEQIVIEAIVSDMPEYNYIKISKNNSLYEMNEFEKVTGAKVTVTDQDNIIYEFKETNIGYYSNNTFIGKELNEYKLNVIIGDKTYSSTSKMPFKMAIDSVSSFVFPSQFTGKIMYIANMYYHDSTYVGNYYRIKVFVNNEPKPEGTFNVFSDDYINGTFSAFSYNDGSLKLGDSVIFYLMNTDEQNYEYFRLLYMNPGMSFSSAPGNPQTNIEGENILGFFGAYSISTDTLVVALPAF